MGTLKKSTAITISILIDTINVETTVDTNAIVINDIENLAPHFVPLKIDGTTRFRQVVQLISASRLFFIESSVHELLNLSNIIFLYIYNPGKL